MGRGTKMGNMFENLREREAYGGGLDLEGRGPRDVETVRNEMTRGQNKSRGLRIINRERGRGRRGSSRGRGRGRGSVVEHEEESENGREYETYGHDMDYDDEEQSNRGVEPVRRGITRGQDNGSSRGIGRGLLGRGRGRGRGIGLDLEIGVVTDNRGGGRGGRRGRVNFGSLAAHGEERENGEDYEDGDDVLDYSDEQQSYREVDGRGIGRGQNSGRVGRVLRLRGRGRGRGIVQDLEIDEVIDNRGGGRGGRRGRGNSGSWAERENGEEYEADENDVDMDYADEEQSSMNKTRPEMLVPGKSTWSSIIYSLYFYFLLRL